MPASPPRGHVKLARKAFDTIHGDPWWLEPREFSKWEAWIDLIQLAQWRDYEHATKYGPVALKRGEFLASLRWLGERWKWGPERVRRHLQAAEKACRLARQREEQGGTVYLIVNYDTYQSASTTSETANETANETATRQRRDKNKQLKQVKQLKQEPPASAGALPKGMVDAAWEAWVATLGSVSYPHLRKALLPVYQSASAAHPSADELVASIEAFGEGRDADGPQWRGKWTVNKWAAELHDWVRLGGMPYVTDYGIPTARATMAKLFGESA